MDTHGRSRLVRRRWLAALSAAMLSGLALACGLTHGATQRPAEGGREVEERIPKHLPIKVKVRKPERLKDGKNEDWLDDAEVEVTNTGTKPIYYLRIHLALPDVLAENGKHYIFPYHYGRIALGDFGEPIQPTDVPIHPGQAVTIRPAEGNISGWKILRGKGRVTSPKRLEFQFQEINHGDGTGFFGRGGARIPTKRQQSSWPPVPPRDENGRDVAAASPPTLSFGAAHTASLLLQPPVFMPAAFSSKPASPTSPAMRDICCQTSRPECVWIRPGRPDLWSMRGS